MNVSVCVWRVLVTKCAGDSQAAQDAPEGDEATSRPGDGWQRNFIHMTNILIGRLQARANREPIGINRENIRNITKSTQVVFLYGIWHL